MAEKMIVKGEPVTSEDIRSQWKNMVYTLEPLTETMPEPYRTYFRSPAKLLIGKEIRLANISKRQMYSYYRQGQLILTDLYYAELLNMDFILRRVSEYLNRLGLSMSEEGLFIKYGFMGYQHLTQRLISEPEQLERRRMVRMG